MTIRLCWRASLTKYLDVILSQSLPIARSPPTIHYRDSPRAKRCGNAHSSIVTCRSARLSRRNSNVLGLALHSSARGLVPFSTVTRMSGISPTSHARNGSPAPSRSLTPRRTVSPLLLPTAGAGTEDPSRRPSIQFKNHANQTRPRGSPRRGQTARRRISSPPPPP